MAEIHLINISVKGNDNSGGLVGKAWNGSSFGRCIVEGSVEGNDNVGGYTGLVDGSTIEYSYSRASVSANHGGGFIGTVRNTSYVKGCYSTGNVNITPETNGGGFIDSSSSTTITECFFDIQTSGFSDSDGGEAYSTAEMKNIKSFTLSPDYVSTPWDFIDNPYNDTGSLNYWDIDASGTINDGYPHLFYENISLSVIPSVYTDPVNDLSLGLPESGGFIRDGGESITETGICWNTTGSPTTSDSKNTGSLSGSSFTATVNNSSRSTTYYPASLRH